MRSFRYVLVDVFTDTPLEGNGLAVFTDARELPEETLQPLARELNLSETVYVYPAEAGRPRADPHLHAHGRAALRRPSRSRDRLRARRAAPASGDRARDRQGPHSGAARARGGADQLRLDEPAGSDGRAVPGRRRAPRRRRRRELRAPRRGLRQRRAPRLRRAPERRGRRGARAGPPGLEAPAGDRRDELLRGRRRPLEDADVRSRGRRSRGSGHGLGRGPARLPPRPARANLVRRRRSSSPRGRRSGARARCTPGSRARQHKIEGVDVGGSAVIVARGEFKLG